MSKEMTNEEYLQVNGVNPAHPNYQKIIDTLNSYGENRWWLSDDPRERAYYQACQDILITDIERYHHDIAILCNRPVFTHELGSFTLRIEAERAWIYGVGVTSEQEREERIDGAVQSFRRMAEEHGKEVIVVEDGTSGESAQ